MKRLRIRVLVALVTLTAIFTGGLTAVERQLRDSTVETSQPVAANAPTGGQAEQPGLNGTARDDRAELQRLQTQMTAGELGDVPFDPTLQRSDDLVKWSKEHHYRVRQLGRWNQTDGSNYPVLRNTEIPLLPGSIRTDTTRSILVVGDSYVFGTGLEAADQAWPLRLEQHLNDNAGTGAYQVTRVGQPRAGMISYANWVTEERIERIKPDMIVLSYHPNDAIPEADELDLVEGRMFCVKNQDDQRCSRTGSKMMPEYRACLRGETGVFGRITRTLLRDRFPATFNWINERYCDTRKIANKLGEAPFDVQQEDPTKNPYTDRFEQAARKIVATAGDIPVLVVPLPNSYEATPSAETFTYGKQFLGLLERSGMEVLYPDLNDAFYTLLFTSTKAERWAHPLDPHYSTMLTDALGRRVAAHLLAKVPPRNSGATKLPVTQPLDQSYLPANLLRDEQPGGSVTFGTPKNEPGFEYGVGAPDELIKDMAAPSTGDGAVHQYVPCMTIGRPHLRVMINPNLEDGTELVVRLDWSAGREVALIFAGYDERNEQRYTKPVPLQPGDSYAFTYDNRHRGVLISHPQAGCNYTADIAMVPAVFTISRS